jgi:hypothetical protein
MLEYVEARVLSRETNRVCGVKSVIGSYSLGDRLEMSCPSGAGRGTMTLSFGKCVLLKSICIRRKCKLRQSHDCHAALYCATDIIKRDKCRVQVRFPRPCHLAAARFCGFSLNESRSLIMSEREGMFSRKAAAEETLHSYFRMPRISRYRKKSRKSVRNYKTRCVDGTPVSF